VGQRNMAERQQAYTNGSLPSLPPEPDPSRHLIVKVGSIEYQNGPPDPRSISRNAKPPFKNKCFRWRTSH